MAQVNLKETLALRPLRENELLPRKSESAETAQRPSTRSNGSACGRVAQLPNATVIAGVVQAEDRSIVAESLDLAQTFDRFFPFERDEAGGLFRRNGTIQIMRRLNRRPHVLLKHARDANYGHWLIAGLPRLAAVEDHFDLGDLGFIVPQDGGWMGDVYEASLALFGIRPDQIVALGDAPAYVDHLIWPTPLTAHPAEIAPRTIEVLEQLATRVMANPFGFERLYVSRNRAGRRRIRNESEVFACVERHGFTVVEPEFLTLYQQIGLFSAARFVVGNYGPALANIAFAPRGATLVSLANEFTRDDTFAALMQLKQGRYLSLQGRATTPAVGCRSDFAVDIERLEAQIDKIV